MDSGRSSIVLALAVALAVPSVNVVPFDGLPFDRPIEIAALAALLPFVFSGSLRATVGALLRRRTRWGPRIALIAVGAAIALKIVLLAAGTDTGFVACYSSTWKPPSGRCEESYSNLFHRHGDATRIDPEIDFGPSSGEQASRLVTAYTTLTYDRGVAATNWNLSFSNDLRFNQARQEGVSLHELMPFAVSWHGTAAIPSDGLLRIDYRGRGEIEIGGTRVELPPTDRSRTIAARVPSGDQPLHATFESPQRSEGAELRLLGRDGSAIGSGGPVATEALAAAIVAVILAAAFVGLIAVALASLGEGLWLLALVALAAAAVALLSSGHQHFGFQYLAALLAPLMALCVRRRPILWAFAALLIIEGAAVLNSVPDLHAVLYRASGTDFLTYEGFARRIVLDGALNGGEQVFFYQPGSRYTTAFMHLLFGDGDVLITWWWMVVIALPFLALLVWHRRRARSSLAVLAAAGVGFLILAVLNSQTIVSLVAMGTSEAPTWALLPLAIAAPQLKPQRGAAWAGSSLAAALIYVVRTNQAVAAATILASIGISLWRRRRRLLWAIAGLCALVLLLPSIHNLVFGGRFVLTTTSAALAQEVQLGQLFHAFDNDALGGLIRGHFSAILYIPPTPGLTHATLAVLLWALLAFWLTALAIGLARLLRRRASWGESLLLLLPIAYLFPHLLYQVEVYFPRHITAGYLAMGASAIGVFSKVTAGGFWALSVPRSLATPAVRSARTLRRVPVGAVSAVRACAKWVLHVSKVAGGALRRLLPSRVPFSLSVSADLGATRVGLVAAAFLAPFSATHLAGPITLGRAVAILFALALTVDLLKARLRPRFSTPALLAAAGYVGLLGWVFLSAAAWGTNAEGKLGGFAELVLVGLLALVALTVAPHLRRTVMLASLAGLTLAAVLALVGVGAINSDTVDLTQTGGRLSGTYGNANELGFAVALGIPIASAFLIAARGRARVVFAAVLAILALALVLTFSRGGIIAAALGLFTVGLWMARGERRRVALVIGAAAAAAVLGIALYAVFQQQREDVSFTAVPVALRPLGQRDLTGWDSRGGGPIPTGPSHLQNVPGGFSVHGHAGEGASYGWGEAAKDGVYELRLRARAKGAGRVPVSYALGDAGRAGGPRGRAVLGPRWQTFQLPWRPRDRAAHARLYVWLRGGAPATFLLSDVSIRAQAPGRPAHTIAVPDKLEGSLYSHMVASVEKEEDVYVQSRLDASHLALKAFVSNPLRGIGWGTFPQYADEHLEYGQLAAHNQYLSIAAELGLVGVAFLVLLGVGIVAGIRRTGRGPADIAAVGAIVAAAAGLVFVEALPVPQLSVPVALVVAVLCARRAAPDAQAAGKGSARAAASRWAR